MFMRRPAPDKIPTPLSVVKLKVTAMGMGSEMPVDSTNKVSRRPTPHGLSTEHGTALLHSAHSCWLRSSSNASHWLASTEKQRAVNATGELIALTQECLIESWLVRFGAAWLHGRPLGGAGEKFVALLRAYDETLKQRSSSAAGSAADAIPPRAKSRQISGKTTKKKAPSGRH